jgi:hypothetical protein
MLFFFSLKFLGFKWQMPSENKLKLNKGFTKSYSHTTGWAGKQLALDVSLNAIRAHSLLSASLHVSALLLTLISHGPLHMATVNSYFHVDFCFLPSKKGALCSLPKISREDFRDLDLLSRLRGMPGIQGSVHCDCPWSSDLFIPLYPLWSGNQSHVRRCSSALTRETRCRMYLYVCVCVCVCVCM